MEFACVKDTMYQVNALNLHINDLSLFSFLPSVCMTGPVTKPSVFFSVCRIDYVSKLVNRAPQMILLIIFCFAWFVLFFVCLSGDLFC